MKAMSLTLEKIYLIAISFQYPLSIFKGQPEEMEKFQFLRSTSELQYNRYPIMRNNFEIIYRKIILEFHSICAATLLLPYHINCETIPE